MHITDFLRDGLLLQAITLAGIALADSGGGEAPAEAPLNPVEEARKRLRSDHGVRLVDGAEEGTGANKLPGGVYGFTNAPLTESPMFATRNYRSFEVHKTVDAECRLRAFATPDEAAVIGSMGDKNLEVRLYPEPYETATEILALPFSRLSMKKLVTSREPGNWIAVTVYPAL